MRFLVDAQLPPALARHLAGKGHVAEHVQELGLLSADDRAIWSRAGELGAVIVSKDEDFASFSVVAADGPQVLWVRIGNATTKELLARLDDAWDAVERALADGERLVELV